MKPNRANALLFTIKNYLSKHILKIIYFAIFDTRIKYASFIWGQNVNAVSRIVML